MKGAIIVCSIAKVLDDVIIPVDIVRASYDPHLIVCSTPGTYHRHVKVVDGELDCITGHRRAVIPVKAGERRGVSCLA